METHFVWKNEFNIGVEIIDKEHKRLFKIINKLFAFKDEEMTSRWACQESVKYFKEHALKHFSDEEAYMASVHYKHFEHHRRLHNSFRDNTLPALEAELKRTDFAPDAMEHFLGVCAGWLIGHTMTEDLAIVGKNAKTQAAPFPNGQLEALKKIIIQLIFDMFHLESHLISDTYGGEKFGNGVYYRLVYENNQNKEKQEILLIFEEKLLINTTGKILGIQTNKLDDMLTHASRYTAKHFVDQVMEQISAEDLYELKSENLLSYEQFQKIFEKGAPNIRLLFDTGAGYFSYCAVVPYTFEENVGISIEAENAINEVKKYLKTREKARKKPKILVVDDSITMRQHMAELLGDDYDVSLAESGVSAIRIITLNKPDLVLLDYEMPICDGRQTLEMLRSDPALGDTPVIFLTGKGDHESVKKVMSLKPAGYLLKYLKPEEIKDNIDIFFEKRKGHRK